MQGSVRKVYICFFILFSLYSPTRVPIQSTLIPSFPHCRSFSTHPIIILHNSKILVVAQASPNKSHTSLLHDTAGRGTSLSQLGGCLIKDNKLIVLLWWSKERFVQCAPLGYKGFSAFQIGPHQIPVFNLLSFQSDNLTPTFPSKGVSSILSFHYVAPRFHKTYKIIFEI